MENPHLHTPRCVVGVCVRIFLNLVPSGSANTCHLNKTKHCLTKSCRVHILYHYQKKNHLWSYVLISNVNFNKRATVWTFFSLHLFACYNATDINRCSFNANSILFVEFHICSSLPNHTHSVFPSELISHSIQIILLFPLTHSLVHLCFGYGQYLNYTILAILCKSRSLMFVELQTLNSKLDAIQLMAMSV